MVGLPSLQTLKRLTTRTTFGQGWAHLEVTPVYRPITMPILVWTEPCHWKGGRGGGGGKKQSVGVWHKSSMLKKQLSFLPLHLNGSSSLLLLSSVWSSLPLAVQRKERRRSMIPAWFLNHELSNNFATLKLEKESYKKLKLGPAIKDEYRSILLAKIMCIRGQNQNGQGTNWASKGETLLPLCPIPPSRPPNQEAFSKHIRSRRDAKKTFWIRG